MEILMIPLSSCSHTYAHPNHHALFLSLLLWHQLQRELPLMLSLSLFSCYAYSYADSSWSHITTSLSWNHNYLLSLSICLQLFIYFPFFYSLWPMVEDFFLYTFPPCQRYFFLWTSKASMVIHSTKKSSFSNLISKEQSTIANWWSLKTVHNPSLIVTQYALRICAKMVFINALNLFSH